MSARDETANVRARLEAHAFFTALSPSHLDVIAACARARSVREGMVLFHEGDDATALYAIDGGSVAVQVHIPHRRPITLETLGPGEILGWSWLFPPYRTRFGAVALTAVELLVIDARTLRARLDEDAALGYALLQRFSRVIAERLEATRLQLLDVYGNQRAAGG